MRYNCLFFSTKNLWVHLGSFPLFEVAFPLGFLLFYSPIFEACNVFFLFWKNILITLIQAMGLNFILKIFLNQYFPSTFSLSFSISSNSLRASKLLILFSKWLEGFITYLESLILLIPWENFSKIICTHGKICISKEDTFNSCWEKETVISHALDISYLSALR